MARSQCSRKYALDMDYWVRHRGAVLAFTVSRLVGSGAEAGERRKRNIDDLKK